MSLKGKRVLVIGGGSGIGLAVAERAVEEGVQVIVASSNAEKVDCVSETFEVHALLVKLSCQIHEVLDASA